MLKGLLSCLGYGVAIALSAACVLFVASVLVAGWLAQGPETLVLGVMAAVFVGLVTLAVWLKYRR